MTQTQLQRHPVRGALWGLLLGLGVGMLLTFVWPVIGLDDIKMVAIKWALIVGGIMFLSILWGLFAPPRKAKGAAQGGYVIGTAPVVPDQPPPAPDDEPPPSPDEPLPPPAEG